MFGPEPLGRAYLKEGASSMVKFMNLKLARVPLSVASISMYITVYARSISFIHEMGETGEMGVNTPPDRVSCYSYSICKCTCTKACASRQTQDETKVSECM